MHRTGRLEYMNAHLERAREKGYFIGDKIVRGAYMEKERKLLTNIQFQLYVCLK